MRKHLLRIAALTALLFAFITLGPAATQLAVSCDDCCGWTDECCCDDQCCCEDDDGGHCRAGSHEVQLWRVEASMVPKYLDGEPNLLGVIRTLLDVQGEDYDVYTDSLTDPWVIEIVPAGTYEQGSYKSCYPDTPTKPLWTGCVNPDNPANLTSPGAVEYRDSWTSAAYRSAWAVYDGRACRPFDMQNKPTN